MVNKIAMLMPRGDYESTPCVKSLAEELVESGFQIDVFTIKNTAFPMPEVNSSNGRLKIFYCPIMSQSSFWENVPLITLSFSVWVYYRLLRGNYNCIVSCGVRALIVSGVYNIFFKNVLIYSSLELYFDKETRSFRGKVFRFLERYFNLRTDYSIIQDSKRASLLAKQNKLDLSSIMLFPNSTRGRAVSPVDDVRTEFSRKSIIEKYSLNKDVKIIIYSGSFFAPWGMIDSLLKSFETWPSDWVLILHSRVNSSDVKKLTQKLNLKKSSNLIISNQALANSEYEYLLQGCDVGIAFYDGGFSDNIKYVGLSSGKISQYLKFGLPILVNELPTLSEINRDYICGVSIHRHEEIYFSLEKIFEDYKSYSVAACRAFEENFMLKKYTLEIVKIIENKNKSV